MKSLWQDTSRQTGEHPHLAGAARCDVLIIGGGMAGILTALCLQEKGLRCIVAEGHRIGQGITAGTTAKITAQQGFLYTRLLRLHGKEQAGLYLDAAETSIDAYERMASKIPCDFMRQSNLVYTLKSRKKAENEMRAMEKLEYPARFREKTALPFQVAAAVEFPDQASFHPLKLLYGAAEMAEGMGLEIYEKTRILRLRRWRDGGWEACSREGSVLADQVVFTSHLPFYNLQGLYFLKQHQSRTFMIAGTSPKLPALDGMYVDEDEKGLTFREGGGMLLMGGGSARTGKAGGGQDEWNSLETLAGKYYRGWKTAYRWAAQDCMTADGLPYIGSYGRNRNGLWAATGFNKWGMTGSMMAARMLSVMIPGGHDPLEHLLSAGRAVPPLPLLENAGMAAANLLKPVTPRCRHMGCALKWNPLEMTWDCPCHGSRYEKDGRCIEGPSKKDLPR